MNLLYRSSNFSPGASRALGNVHLHVDCPSFSGVEDDLVRIALKFESHGWPSKVTGIVTAQAGTHLRDPEFASDYAQHTPELGLVDNTFTAYLTALLESNVSKTKEAIALCAGARSFVNENLYSNLVRDSVIEIERVSAIVDANGVRFAEPVILRTGHDHGAPFEVHHFANLPPDSEVTFENWARCCVERGISVGGWFQFNRTSDRAFRSVRFSRLLDIEEVKREMVAVQEVARELAGAGVHVESIVEEILDIWRI
jgi:hypothetical protein